MEESIEYRSKNAFGIGMLKRWSDDMVNRDVALCGQKQ